MSESTQVVMSVDMELMGPNHPIKAIGAAITLQPSNQRVAEFKVALVTNTYKGQTAKEYWMHPDNAKMRSFIFSAIMDLSDREVIFRNCGFDFHCLKQFWLKHIPLLRELDNCAVPYNRAISQFLWFYEQQSRQFGDSLIVVSDNPAVDMALVNKILAQRNLLPVSYSRPGCYRDIIDVRMLIKGIMGVTDPKDTTYIKKFCDHFHLPFPKTNHDPLADALKMAQLYGYVLRVCRQKQVSKSSSPLPAPLPPVSQSDPAHISTFVTTPPIVPTLH